MTLRKPPVALDYAKARPQVWSDMKNEARDKIRAQTLKYLRNKADIVTAKDH